MKVRSWGIATTMALVMVAGLGPIVRSQPEESREPLGSSWSRRVPGVIGLAVSPGGARVLALNLYERLLCYDDAGSLLWARDSGGADRVATSQGGALTLTYSTRQPLAREVSFIDEGGRRIHVLTPAEPVECAVVSADGRRAAIAAGKSLLFCSRGKNGIRHRVVRLPGEARQVQLGPADTMYVACRNPHLVQLVKSSGKVLWRRKAPNNTAYSIAASEDGRLLAIGNQETPDRVQVSLVTSRNESRWTDVRAGRAPQVRISASGATATLAYQHQVAREHQSRFEQRLTYLGEGMRGAWPKGGSFTAPVPV
ncbi:MAG TPA: hypothetical protein VK689_02140, partial [Armatimonadota bacterium]|nr:hypothetical protein [Armatimonadota bacterium]